ncbi:MAG: hypothetical protein JWN22_662 [Nocardioides sp.]|jgi:hypothetical protein|nr:hypothetical protein [Nocardioides sp.]
MSEFALNPADMHAASAAADSAAAAARGSDGSDALSALAAALPGSTTAETVPELGSAWEAGVSGWSEEVDSLSHAIDDLAVDGARVDGQAGSAMHGLVGGLGPR